VTYEVVPVAVANAKNTWDNARTSSSMYLLIESPIHKSSAKS